MAKLLAFPDSDLSLEEEIYCGYPIYIPECSVAVVFGIMIVAKKCERDS